MNIFVLFATGHLQLLAELVVTLEQLFELFLLGLHLVLQILHADCKLLLLTKQLGNHFDVFL